MISFFEHFSYRAYLFLSYADKHGY